MRCPRCGKMICDCLLEDPGYLARIVGKELSHLSGCEARSLTTKKSGIAASGRPTPNTLPPSRKEKPTFKSSCKITIEKSDVIDTLKKMEDNTYDGCLSDPPYGLTSIGKRFGKADSQPPKTDKGAIGAYGRIAKGFMGQTWDCSVPSLEVCQELLRVCKPGSWMLLFGHPRTFHRLMCNVEDAGWVLRDCIMWLYGQGFPKSHDLGKAMGNDAWNGHGTCLKPGYEPVILAMKPLDGSFANNARKWGVAGLNIKGCQIGQEEITINQWMDGCKPFGNGAGHPYESTQSEGRFPANVILDEDAAQLLDRQSPVRKNGTYRKSGQRDPRHKGQQLYGGGIGGGQQNAPDCYGDAGGASRFFYCAKANPNERNAGLVDFPIDRPDKRSGKAMGHFNEKGIQPQQYFHPCVKPIALNKWLSKLILPPKRSDSRKLLVPFCGSGSEIIGAMRAGWDEIVGIEGEAKYVEIANKRIEWWKKNG